MLCCAVLCCAVLCYALLHIDVLWYVCAAAYVSSLLCCHRAPWVARSMAKDWLCVSTHVETSLLSADKVFADSPGQCPSPNATTAKSQPGGYCPTYVYDGEFCASSQPAWSAFREPAFGHGVLTFENSTHALWAWNRNLDGESVNMDTVYVIRQLSCSNKASFAVGAAPTAGTATATAG